ncbi:hypothetical protein BC829DRAFT_400666 [Chytridium lagenaria]|nr:hypothetical protein BC829DRAFT_400666 [Chytridium lagenaria]
MRSMVTTASQASTLKYHLKRHLTKFFGPVLEYFPSPKPSDRIAALSIDTCGRGACESSKLTPSLRSCIIQHWRYSHPPWLMARLAVVKLACARRQNHSSGQSVVSLMLCPLFRT